MDPYADEILEALGLPTTVTRFRELDYFQILGVDPSIDSNEEIMKAASARMRKVREFAKGGTRDYAREMERLIIQGRNTLGDPAKRRRYCLEKGFTTGGGPGGLIEIEGEPRVAAERTAYDKAAPVKKGGGKIFLVILLILIALAVIAVVKYGTKEAKEKGSDLLDRARETAKDISKEVTE